MNVKKGDLAIIVGCHQTVKENIGRIVEVIEFAGDRGESRNSDWWFVRMVGGPGVCANGNISQEGYCRDISLRPVSGIPDEDEVKEVKKELA